MTKPILIFILFISQVSWSAPACKDLAARLNQNQKDSRKVEISKLEFDTSTQKLRKTLSGKLATVWRSEWKTKLTVTESNQYMLDLVHNSLTPETQKSVLEGLDSHQEGFVRKIHERMSTLQDQNKLQPKDDLAVRDKPAPKGAWDTTFTYYTKALSTSTGEGKHQLRIRTYLRKINYKEMNLNEAIQGVDTSGQSLSITKLSADQYKVADKNYTEAEIKNTFGDDIRWFAPHGKSFKLEVKTALKDEISDKKFPLLAGQHMVQKLDVSLSLAQVQYLFAPIEGLTTVAKQKALLQRIDKVTAEVIAKNPENQDRAAAVFLVIKNGILKNDNFMEIEGATVYHRTAFESKSGFQTTIDRDQGVYSGSMYTNHGLKNPMQVVQKNHLMSVQEKDARHVELKVPVTAMQNAAGIQFHEAKSAPAPIETGFESQLNSAIQIYYGYVKNTDHSGKFNYIQKNSDD